MSLIQSTGNNVNNVQKLIVINQFTPVLYCTAFKHVWVISVANQTWYELNQVCLNRENRKKCACVSNGIQSYNILYTQVVPVVPEGLYYSSINDSWLWYSIGGIEPDIC